ncbi:MAG: hypothetical protein ACOC5D_01355 [Thermoplasmatota archaeon]
MTYCFYCKEEVDADYRCPECGRKLFPDVKFSDYEETQVEKIKKQIRRRKLEEAHRHEVNSKIYISKDDENSEKTYKSMPVNYTSVREYIRYKEKEEKSDWEKEEVRSSRLLKGFRYVLLFISIIFLLKILEIQGYLLNLEGFDISILPDMTSNVFLAFFLLIFIFMIVLPLLIVLITTGSSYDVKKRRW